jgi:hypothetical protein
MRKPIPRVLAFDNRNPDKVVLYPMPMPEGMRVIAVSTASGVKIYSTNAVSTNGEITGFAPSIERVVAELHQAMLSEPSPGMTQDGFLKYKPGMVFDMILHDRTGHGSATKTIAAFDSWCFDEEWPVPSADVCAFVMAALPIEAFEKGRDVYDLWQRRAHVMRGCMRLGMANPYAHPHPAIRPMTMAPDNWASPAFGCAGRGGKMFWNQVENCFKNGYVGCLVIDVMQPWDVRGNAFQVIKEEDFI